MMMFSVNVEPWHPKPAILGPPPTREVVHTSLLAHEHPNSCSGHSRAKLSQLVTATRPYKEVISLNFNSRIYFLILKTLMGRAKDAWISLFTQLGSPNYGVNDGQPTRPYIRKCIQWVNPLYVKRGGRSLGLADRDISDSRSTSKVPYIFLKKRRSKMPYIYLLIIN